MKTVYVLNVFPKISETFILNEIVQAQKQGVEIEIITFAGNGEDRVHPDVEKIKRVVYFKPGRKWSSGADHLYWLFRSPLRYLKTLTLAANRKNGITRWFLFNLHNIRLIESMKPDHIHAHFGTWTTDLAMIAGLLTGVPFTFTTHSYDIFSFPPGNMALKSRLAKRHITISEYNRKYLVERFGVPSHKIEVIHCGVDFTKIPKKVARAGSNKLVTIARLEKTKGLDHLIRCYRLLKDRGCPFEAIIIGDGTRRRALERLIDELDLRQDVRLLGNRTQNNIFEILQTCRLMVMTSTVEGIPVSLMEAMAFQVPVIATRITGVPELIDDGKNGFLVETTDTEVLVDRIQRLLSDDSLRARFAENGLKKVLSDFNLEHEVAKLILVWKSSS